MHDSPARVEEVMTRHVFSVPPDAPFKAIVTELTYRRVSALPVVDRDRRPVGVVSEADLLVSRGLTAADLMSSPVISVRPDTPVWDAARTMHDRGIKRLVVVDAEGRIAGIVTRGDLLRVFLRGDAEIRRAVQTLAERDLWLDTRDLTIQVAEGVITLRGLLPDRSSVEKLVSLAGELDGVVGVRNELQHARDDASRPTPSAG